jgi:DNA-directed RNA polymerase specialized sigma24 family protein
MVLEKRTGYVDAQEAARMLGVNQRAVRNLVARRRLESKRDGGLAGSHAYSPNCREQVFSETRTAPVL